MRFWSAKQPGDRQTRSGEDGWLPIGDSGGDEGLPKIRYLLFLMLVFGVSFGAHADSLINLQLSVRALPTDSVNRKSPQDSMSQEMSQGKSNGEDQFKDISLAYAGSALWSGATDAVIGGKFAFCAFITGIEIFDIDNVDSPRSIGRLYMEKYPYNLYIKGNLLFSGWGSDGFVIFEISNCSNPKLIGKYEKNHTRGLTISGDYVYVLCGLSMEIVDISNPSMPRFLSSIDFPYDNNSMMIPSQVNVRAGYAYVAAGDLYIIDVTDPIHPREANRIDTPQWATGLDISGNDLYIIARFGMDPGEWFAFANYDISDPNNPVLVASKDYPARPNNITIMGKRAYISAGFEGVLVFNIEDRKLPYLEGCFRTSAFISRVIPFDSNLFVTHGTISALDCDTKGYDLCKWPMNPDSESILYSTEVGSCKLAILDVSEISNPVVRWALKDPSESKEALGLKVEGGFAYIRHECQGISILGINGPDTIAQAGYLATSGPPQDEFVSGNLLYIAEAYEGLRIADVSNQLHPVTIAQFNSSGFATGVFVYKGYAYLANGDLQVIDISDPRNPSLDTSISIPGRILNVAIKDDLAFVGASSGFVILDISNPHASSIVGRYPINGSPYTIGLMALEGERAYISCPGAKEFQMLDISNPHNPRYLATFKATNEINDMAARDSFIYLASNDGVDIIGVSGFDSPFQIAHFRTPTPATGIDLIDTGVLVSTNYSVIKLKILRIFNNQGNEDQGILPPDR